MELLKNRTQMEEVIKKDPRLRRILLVKIVSCIEHMTRWETKTGKSAYQENGSMDLEYVKEYSEFLDVVWQEIERFGTCHGVDVNTLYPLWCKTMIDLGFEKDFDFLLTEPEEDKIKLRKLGDDYAKVKELKEKVNEEIIYYFDNKNIEDGSSTTTTSESSHSDCETTLCTELPSDDLL